MQLVKKGIHFIAEGSNAFVMDIMFCHKNDDGKFVDGLTNEEMVDVMIARFQHLVEKFNSTENINCLHLARKMKVELQERNKLKIKRKSDDNSRNSVPV